MTKAPPPISVCIPVYNGADFIAESVASVLAQTRGDFELVVCDNVSSDRTAEIVRAIPDPRLTYIRNERNLGLVGNFNRCLSLARAAYVCVWHHDDVMLPRNLEEKVRVLDAYPWVGLVHSNILQIDATGRALGEHWAADSRRDYIEDGTTYFERLVRGFDLICCPSVVARRECYERLGGFSDRITSATDWEMWLRIALHYDVACLGEPLIKCRWHGANVSSMYKGLHGFEEEWVVKSMALDNAQGRLPEVNRLRREVFDALIDSILHRAYESFCRQETRAALAYCALACRLRPRTIGRSALWSLLARLAAGRTGAAMYRAAIPPAVHARATRAFHRQFWARR